MPLITGHRLHRWDWLARGIHPYFAQLPLAGVGRCLYRILPADVAYTYSASKPTFDRQISYCVMDLEWHDDYEGPGRNQAVHALSKRRRGRRGKVIDQSGLEIRVHVHDSRKRGNISLIFGTEFELYRVNSGVEVAALLSTRMHAW